MDELVGRTAGQGALVVERRTEDAVQTSKQLALIRQSITQVAWGPASREDARQIQRRVVDEGVERVMLAGKESADAIMEAMRQQWGTAKEASLRNEVHFAKQERDTTFLKQQSELLAASVEHHGNRAHAQLLAQSAHLTRQDERAARAQEAMSLNYDRTMQAIAGLTSAVSSAVTGAVTRLGQHPAASWTPQQVPEASVGHQHPSQQSYAPAPAGPLSPLQLDQYRQYTVRPPVPPHTPRPGHPHTHPPDCVKAETRERLTLDRHRH